MTTRAVFLDRDGTLNVDHGYVGRREDWQWVPGALEAVGAFNKMGFKVVVVSNQSGVARGMFSEAAVRELNGWAAREAALRGATIDAFYFCPHLDGCDCRKPLPGLLLRAARELDIDLSLSFMIGDSLRDVEAGVAAGVTSILLGGGGDLPPGVLRAAGWGEVVELVGKGRERIK